MLIEAWARENTVRDRAEIDLYTPESIPMAVAGPAVGQGLCALMDERGISYHFNHQVESIDKASRTIRFGQGDVAFDVLIGIPPHRAPALLQEAGMIDSSGYVSVHPQTLEILSDLDTLQVQFPGVYAIGDVAAIRLMNSMLLPKAGVFAEGEAQIVAAAIAADIQGTDRPGVYDGNGFCYVEVGDGKAAYGSGNFYAYPGPRVNLDDPSADSLTAKQEYEALLDTWFYT
jgi:sulfide:quinone oxidoreductase